MLSSLSVRALLPIVIFPLTFGCRKAEVTISVEPSEIQSRVSAMFPVSREAFFSRVTLENPKVVLPQGQNRIGVELQVRAQAPVGPEVSGRVGVSGGLAYRALEKAFYLREPTLDRLEVPGLTGEHNDQIRVAAEAVVQAVLSTHPVYQFQERDLKEITAEHTLRDVAVKDGKVYVTLGLPR